MHLTDEQLFFMRRLYEEMYSMLIGHGYILFEDKGLVEEAVQETFLQACLNIKKVMNHPNPRGWLVKALPLVMKNLQRRQASFTRKLITYLSFSPDELVTHDSMSPELMYLGTLTTEEIHLLKLTVLQGKTNAEAAEIMGISEEACKKRSQRVRKKIRDAEEKENKKF